MRNFSTPTATEASNVPTFSTFFREVYRPLKLLGRSEATVQDYEACLGVWERTCGERLYKVKLGDVAAFLATMAETRAPATVNKYRRYLLAILRLATRLKVAHAADWIEDVPKMPETHDDPEAYMIEEVDRLLNAARQQRGMVCDVPARRWWPALILTIYDTGSRISATMSIKTEHVDVENRTVRIAGSSQKNKRGVLHTVSRQAAAAIALIYSDDRGQLFPWPFDQGCRQWQYLVKHFRKIITQAELPQPKDPFHKLRRTCASYCEAAGISAQQQMGHSSGQTTQAYLDPRIVRRQQASDVLPRPSQQVILLEN